MNKNTIKKIIASGLIIAIIATGTEIADKSSQVAGTNSINTIVGAEEITRSATDFEKERPTITSVINNKNSTTIKWNKIELNWNKPNGMECNGIEWNVME